MNKIRLEVRSYHSPDVDFHTWNPTTLAQVYFLLEMEIAEIGAEGTDLFQVVVATPEALREKTNKISNTIRERSTIIVSNYNWHEIKESLEAIVRKCESNSWVNSVYNLERYFKWEYEDYKMEVSTE